MHFVDLMHRRLQIERCLGRVDTYREVIENDLASVFADLRDILFGWLRSQHVEVGYNEEAFVLLLESQPVL